MILYFHIALGETWYLRKMRKLICLIQTQSFPLIKRHSVAVCITHTQ